MKKPKYVYLICGHYPELGQRYRHYVAFSERLAQQEVTMLRTDGPPGSSYTIHRYVGDPRRAP